MSQYTHFHSSNCLGQTTLESFLIPVSLPFQIPTMNKLYSQNILGNWPLFTHSNSNVPYILLSQSIQRDHRPLLLKTTQATSVTVLHDGAPGALVTALFSPPWGFLHKPPVKHGLAQDLHTRCSVWKILPPDTWLADFLISSGLCSNIY